MTTISRVQAGERATTLKIRVRVLLGGFVTCIENYVTKAVESEIIYRENRINPNMPI
jgi:hypothetical protein